MRAALRRVVPVAFLGVAGVTLIAGLTRAQPGVSGGGSFEGAPALEPGAYTDVIRSGETLFYAFDLGPRQRLRARLSIQSPGDHPPAEVHLRVFNTRRLEDPFAHEPAVIRDRARVRLATATSRVGPDNPDYPEPGRHFLSLSTASLPSPRGFDVTLRVAVDTRAAPNDAPAKPERSEAEAEPSRAGSYALSFAAGLVLGALAEIVRRALRPARRLRQGL